MTIFGDGTQTRAFSYIDDVAPVMAEAIDATPAWDEMFNVGADQPYTLNELAAAVARAMGVEPRGRPPRRRATRCSTRIRRQSALTAAFGPRRQTPLDEGLRRWPTWARRTARRPSAPFEAIEVTKNLPAAWRARKSWSAGRPATTTSTCREDPARAVVWARRSRSYLRPWVPPDAHVLEIGAGYCCWINAVAAARRVAVDSWPEIARHAAPGVEAVVLDASSGWPSSPTGAFDVVLASNVIEHFEPEAAAARRERDRAAAASRRPADRHPAELPLRVSAILRRLHAPLDVHARVARRTCCVARVAACCGSSRGSCPYSMRESRLPVQPWLVRAYLRSPIRPLAGPDAGRGAERLTRARTARQSASSFLPTTRSSTSVRRSRTS